VRYDIHTYIYIYVVRRQRLNYTLPRYTQSLDALQTQIRTKRDIFLKNSTFSHNRDWRKLNKNDSQTFN
jgi:hypothetical protein